MISNRFINDGRAIVPLTQTQKEVLEKTLAQYQGFYQFEQVKCLCQSDNQELIAEKDRYGLPNPVVICKDCGLAFSSPRLCQDSFNHFYEHHYRSLYTGAKRSTLSFFINQLIRGRNILEFIESSLSVTLDSFEQKVLEIGCGAGGILAPFKLKGTEAIGIDIGSSYLDYGRQWGLDLRNIQSSQMVQQYNSYFDIVIISHVLEHFLDIPQELANIRKIMKKDAILYIEVPGIYYTDPSYGGDFLRSLQNAHTYYFTKQTLIKTLEENGFSFFAGTEEIKSIFINRESDSKISYRSEYGIIKAYLDQLEEKIVL